MTDEIKGIGAVLNHKLQQEGIDEPARSRIVDLYALVGENASQLADTKDELANKESAFRMRNSAGGIGKEKTYRPKKAKVFEIYNSLKAANDGKNPKFKLLSKKVEEIYSEDELSSYTLRDWHKKLNKGQPL